MFYAADEYHNFYWISSPDVTHSRNIAVRPDVSIVIFDSRSAVGPGAAGAVYIAASATEIPQAELDRTPAGAPSFARHGHATSQRSTSGPRRPTASTAPP